MNFYALNSTPINGWATGFGFGQADFTLDAEGVSAEVDLGAGSASLVLESEADGTRRTFAEVTATLELESEADGTRRVPAEASADFEIELEGDGTATQVVGGTATLLLTWPSGAKGGIFVHAEATATLQLQPEADGRVAAGRYGEAWAYMLMQVDGAARKAVPVKAGGLAEMWVYPSASGYLVTSNAGAAMLNMEVDGEGRGSVIRHGAGQVGMRFEALRVEGRQHRQINGAGDLGIAFDLTLQDARVAVLPDAFYPAPAVRTARLNRENRRMRVARAGRTAEILGA